MVDPQPLGAGHCTDSLPMRGPGVRPALSHWHPTTMPTCFENLVPDIDADRNPGIGDSDNFSELPLQASRWTKHASPRIDQTVTKRQ